MTRFVVRTELRRTVGPLLPVVWGALSCLLALTHPEWAGELLSLTIEQRIDLIVLGPVALTLAVWHGGRDRRLGISELLGSVPASSWRRHAVRWGVLTAALSLGTVLTTVVGGGFVLLHTTYWGGRWAAVLLICCAATGAMVALGLAIGMLWSGRVLAPVAGLVGYVLLGAPGYVTTSAAQYLLPNGIEVFHVAERPTLVSVAATLVFFAALAVTFLASVSRGRRLLTVPAALVALAVGLVAGSQPMDWWWEPDPVAAAPVCSTDTPRVCVMRTHAELLPAVDRAVRPVLDGLGDLAPSHGARERPDSETSRDDSALYIDLGFAIPLVGNHLLRPEEVQGSAAMSEAARCDSRGVQENRRYIWVGDLEPGWTALVLHQAPDPQQTSIGAWRQLRTATPSVQRRFMQQYQAAGRTCDWAALHRLHDRWMR